MQPNFPYLIKCRIILLKYFSSWLSLMIGCFTIKSCCLSVVVIRSTITPFALSCRDVEQMLSIAIKLDIACNGRVFLLEHA